MLTGGGSDGIKQWAKSSGEDLDYNLVADIIESNRLLVRQGLAFFLFWDKYLVRVIHHF